MINLAQRHKWQSWRGLSFSSSRTIPEPFQNGWCSIAPSAVPAISHNPSSRTSPRGLSALKTMNEDLKNGCTSHLPWMHNPYAPKGSQTLHGHCCVWRLTCTGNLCLTPTVQGHLVLSVQSGFGGLFLFKKNLRLPQPLPGLPFLLILKRLQGFLQLCS